MRRLFLVLILCVLLVPSVNAVAIGVNRATLDFQDVLRGGYAREELVVTTDSDVPIYAEVYIEGEAAEWFTFSAREFNFTKDEPFYLSVDVAPPLDAEVRDYAVNLSILTGEIYRSGDGNFGTSTRASLGIKIQLAMTGNEIASCKVAGVSIFDTEEGQNPQVELTIMNTGNVRLNPDIEIVVFDKFRVAEVASATQIFGLSVLPTLTSKAIREFQMNNLRPDQYWASVSVPRCNYAGTLTFDVLEPGGTKDDGDFIRIDSESWVNVGDIVPIFAVFRNKGIRSVRAVFKGTITDLQNDQIVKVIDTETYLVDPGLTAELETFFNPTLPGRYMVTGKIFYNNKLTTERNYIINVLPEGDSKPLLGSSYKLTFGLVLVIIAILLLLILIRRRKSRHRGWHPQYRRR